MSGSTDEVVIFAMEIMRTCDNDELLSEWHTASLWKLMEFSLNGAELSLNSVNSANSENLRNHWSMNWVQYKDLLCYLCLCGLVVSSLSLTQEILGSNPTMLIFYFISFCHWIQRIQWKHLEKTPICSVHFSKETWGHNNVFLPLHYDTFKLCHEPVYVRVYSHQAKEKAKAKKIKEQSQKWRNERQTSKKNSFSLSLLLGLNGP